MPYYQKTLTPGASGTRLTITVPPLHPCLTETASTWMELCPFVTAVTTNSKDTMYFTFKFRKDTDEHIERILAAITEDRHVAVQANVAQLFDNMCKGNGPLDAKTFYLVREYVAIIAGVPCDTESFLNTSDRALVSARAHMTAITFGAELDLKKFQLVQQ
jgi:hypothetical protein